MTNPGVVTSCSLALKDWTLLLSSGPVSLRVDTFPVASICETMFKRSSMVGDYIAAGCGGSALSVLVASDHAVAVGDHAVRVLGDVVLVSNHDDGVPLRVQAVHQGHDLVTRFGVEISGRLVGQND